jgi:hypothetical protein
MTDPRSAFSAPAHPDDPVVRHFGQILMWPLQLMPIEGHSDELPRHWEYLQRSTDDHPWRELTDEFTEDPAEFQERHYREFTTFLPHVQRFLYGQARSVAGHVGYGESPIRIFRRHDVAACRMKFADDLEETFRVQHVDLYFFFDIDIVMLVVEVAADELPLSRVQEVLYRFGRASPAGWNADGNAQSCLRDCSWLGHAGEVLASSDLNDRATYLRYTGQHRAQNVSAHWRFLLEPMVMHHSEAAGVLRYRQIEYHRIPKLSYLSLDDPFALSDEAFARLTLATRAEPGRPLPYSPRTLEQVASEMTYDRFWNPALKDHRASMRVGCNGHALVMVGSAQSALYTDEQAGLLGQFRHEYFLVGLIAHFHKAALHSVSDQLITAVSLLDVEDSASVRQFRATIRAIRESFLRFNHRYWFHEVSNQSMASDLFELWHKQLRTDALFQELREEILDMGQYLDSDDARRQGDAVLRLTVVTILGLIGTIATGFLGMNLIDEADNPLPVKIGYFACVLVPTLLMTLVTVRYSRALSEVLDALADDERGSWRARWRSVREIVAGRRRRGLRPPQG